MAPAPMAAPAAKQSKEAAPATHTLYLAIHSVHGVRPADLLGNKSDVFVEVYIDGKEATSKVTTHVVSSKAAPPPRVSQFFQVQKDAVSVTLNFEGELPNYAAGDTVCFVIKDRDMIGHDVLGHYRLAAAAIQNNVFGGILEGFSDGGEGHYPFMFVQLGHGKGMEEAVNLYNNAYAKYNELIVTAAAKKAADSAAAAAAATAKKAADAAAAAAAAAAPTNKGRLVEVLPEKDAPWTGKELDDWEALRRRFGFLSAASG